MKGFCRWNESPKSVELVIWRWLCGPNLITYPLKAESFLSWCENKSERQVSASLKKESKHVTCVVRGQVASKSWKWAWLMGSKTTKTSVLHLQGNEYLEENLKPQMSMCSLISACVTWSEDPANLYLGSWPKATGEASLCLILRFKLKGSRYPACVLLIWSSDTPKVGRWKDWSLLRP